MKKKLIPVGIAVITVVSGIIVLYHSLIRYLLPMYLGYMYLDKYDKLHQASSIGIIGGADGPTAIYLSNSSDLHLLPVFVLLFIAGVIYFVFTLIRRITKRR